MSIILVGLFLALSSRNAIAQPGSDAPPPVAQSLVREGDFATKLVETFSLGSVGSEAEAESALGSVGIAPKSGWIADYPVTPDILIELRDAVKEAADSGRLSMSTDDALLAFNSLAAESGLPVVSDSDSENAVKDAGNYSQYTDPTIINNYYYSEGPPVVTYYPPPWDYYSFYAWVPYPFWWSSFWFPGFFILHDFNKVVVIRKMVVKVVTNHVYDPGRKMVITLDHATRISRTSQSGMGIGRAKDQSFTGSQSGGRSISPWNREQMRVRNPDSQGMNRGASGSGITSREPGGSFAFSGNGAGISSAPPRVERRSLGSSSVRGSGFSAPVNSGGRAVGGHSVGGAREMGFQRTSPRIEQPFRTPSSGARGSGEGFRRAGSGGFVDRGFSGRGCRGRC